MQRINSLNLGDLGLCVLVVLAAGCAAETSDSQSATPSNTPAVVTVVDGEELSEAERSSMLAAKDALFERLSGRLSEVVSTKGPAAAIKVCKEEAPQLADEVEAEHRLRIGRTGVRLRNPNNTAPAWADSLTTEKVDEPHFVRLSSGDAAALLPIQLQAKCLMCHGPQDQLAPVVQEQLARLYPDDRATGFEEGELRGWFWVELPAN